MTVLAESSHSSPGRSTSFVASIIDKLILLCAIVPYAVVAVGLRLVIARVFFLDGQSKIDGPTLPLDLSGVLSGVLNQTIVLPAQIKDSTFQLFQTQYAGLPLAPTTAAYLFTYAEFVLPVLLVLGFATRFAAVGLFAMTVLLSVYVMPQAFWSLHVYWAAILLVLMSLGAGAISVDTAIRKLFEK